MGGASSPVTITVRPRIQKDKWSLYWKESMQTKTEILSDVTIQVSPSTTVREVQALLQQKMEWPAADSAERLEGFKDPWETALYKGCIMNAADTLKSHGIDADATVVCVRRVLVPEAWKVIEEGQDEDDFSSDEEEWSQDDF